MDVLRGVCPVGGGVVDRKRIAALARPLRAPRTGVMDLVGVRVGVASRLAARGERSA